MSYFAELVVSGLAIGAIYGLVAMAFAVIYKATGIVNFAQGEMGMLTAYTTWSLATTMGTGRYRHGVCRHRGGAALGLVASGSSCGRCWASQCCRWCW
jgi:branched-chain amino acid transport system permease protein